MRLVPIGVLWLLASALPAGAETVPVDRAGAWLSVDEPMAGHRIFTAVAGGSVSARSLADCSGFVDAAPRLELLVEPGVEAIDIVAHADRPVRVIAYRSATDRVCGELSQRSAVRLLARGQRYRVYLAGAHRDVRHPVVLGIAPAASAGEGSRPLGRSAVGLRRAEARLAWRRRFDLPKTFGRPFRYDGRNVFALSTSLNTLADSDTAVPLPAPEDAPLRFGGTLGRDAEPRECNRSVGARHRVLVAEQGGPVALRALGSGALALAVTGPEGSVRCFGARASFWARPGAYTVGVHGAKAATYSLEVARCSTRSSDTCTERSPKAVGGTHAAKIAGALGIQAAAARSSFASVERLQTEGGTCTATHVVWRGRPALVTAAHCLYEVSPGGSLGRRFHRARLGRGEVDLRGAVVARSFERCARAGRSYHECSRAGADDIAVIPHAGARSPWPMCEDPPAGDQVYSLGYGLTERGAPRGLVAARLALARRRGSARGVWRARRRGVYVQPGDSGGPVVSARPTASALPSVCFVVSGLDERSSVPVSLLQPLWDLEQRLAR